MKELKCSQMFGGRRGEGERQIAHWHELFGAG